MILELAGSCFPKTVKILPLRTLGECWIGKFYSEYVWNAISWRIRDLKLETQSCWLSKIKNIVNGGVAFAKAYLLKL